MDSDQQKIVFGVVTAVGVVVASYLLFFRKSQPKGGKPKAEVVPSKSKAAVPKKKIVTELPFSDQSTLNDVEDNLNQASFGFNNQAIDRKSDRSSDESSYDVVDAEDVERVDRTGLAESLLGPDNEGSMIVVEPENLEVSNSSFYQSAEDTFHEGQAKSPETSVVEEIPFQSVSPTKEEVKTLPSKSNTSFMSTASVAKPKANTSFMSTASVAKPKAAAIGSGDVLEGSNTSFINKARAANLDVKMTKPPLREKSEVVVVERELTAQEITEALTACQNSPDKVTNDQVAIIVTLLQQNNDQLQPTVLDSLVRVSGFTHNNVHLRGAHCDIILCEQIIDTCSLMLRGSLKDESRIIAETKVLTNLSIDPQAVQELEACVPSLIEVFITATLSKEVSLSMAQPLINFSSQEDFHPHFVPAIQHLYSLLDDGDYELKVQCTRILVNLSLDHQIIPHMLSAKAPESLLDLLENKPTTHDLILRLLSVIGNLRAAIAKHKISQTSLPHHDKAESPKTMFTALCGVVKAPLLRNKVYRLTRHTDSDIRTQASKLYTLITMVKK